MSSLVLTSSSTLTLDVLKGNVVKNMGEKGQLSTMRVLIIVFIVYRVLMLGTVSATLGQMAAGLRVVKLGEGPDARLGWGAAVVRGTAGAFVYVLWYLTLVSGVCLLVNRNRQSLQDLVARTYVLKIR